MFHCIKQVEEKDVTESLHKNMGVNFMLSTTDSILREKV